MNDNKNFLPIGSVCRLKNGKKNVMITGFCPISNEINKKMYDYCGCIYPEGMFSSDVNLLFDNGQIEELIFKGYENAEENEFKNKLNELIKSKLLEENQVVKETTIQANNDRQIQPVVEPNVVSQPTFEIQHPVQNIVQPNVQNPQPPQNSSTNSIDLFSTLPSQPNIDNFGNNN